MVNVMSLRSCLWVIPVVIASLCACATRQPPTEADRSLAARVAVALDDDPNLYARHVDVYADDGVIHLTGFVFSPNELLYAKHDARSVPGVRGVADELELMRGGVNGTGR
jgi:BON domain